MGDGLDYGNPDAIEAMLADVLAAMQEMAPYAVTAVAQQVEQLVANYRAHGWNDLMIGVSLHFALIQINGLDPMSALVMLSGALGFKQKGM